MGAQDRGPRMTGGFGSEPLLLHTTVSVASDFLAVRLAAPEATGLLDTYSTAMMRDGGCSAGRPVDRGAAGVVWAATLPASGLSGGFFRDRQALPW